VKAAASNPVCIVSHDAGGAEVLACYAVENGLDCRLVLEGPAVAVFRRHMGSIALWPLADALASSDWCLLGTSWQSDIEWRALREATRLGKRTVTFLDHWVNYAERFVRGGVQALPDEIWVGDEDAHVLARQHFPHTAIRLVPNPYFGYVQREIARCEARRSRIASAAATVLFVCENLSGHARMRFEDERHWGYTEFDAIEYFFRRIGDLGTAVSQVTLRPHPSDPEGKYSEVVSAHAPLARLSSGKPLLEEIAESDIVVGCESMAMIAAALARRRVLCAVPPGKKTLFIERRRGIEMLRDLPTRSATVS
jgi:hypothetical protein